MLSMKKEYGFRTFLDSYVLANLQKYFKNVNQIPQLEQLCSDKYLWTDVNKSPQHLANDSDLSTGHAISYVTGVSMFAVGCWFLTLSLFLYVEIWYLKPLNSLLHLGSVNAQQYQWHTTVGQANAKI